MENKDDKLAEVILNIIRTSNLLERLGGKYAHEVNLGSVHQYMILALLSTAESLTMGELRQNTLVTKQAITGLVERLKQGNYVTTYKDSNDRRVTRVTLTAKGKETLFATRPKRIKGNRAAFSVLNEQEIDQLAKIITKLVEHLK